jgi:hypothetical protein
MTEQTADTIRRVMQENGVPTDMTEKAIARANAVPLTGNTDLDVQRIALAISACIDEERAVMRAETKRNEEVTVAYAKAEVFGWGDTIH